MAHEPQAFFRKIPAVDRLLMTPALRDASRCYPRELLLRAVNDVLCDLRAGIRDEVPLTEEDFAADSVADRAALRAEELAGPSLKPVINATGVVVHTNLGRSVLADRVLRNFRSLAGGYSNLEYDLERGARGSRYVHVEAILKELTGAEAAMVVNNNAAAVFVALETLARGKEVVVSRGQLVEIGGSFRIPDVMSRSGATMVEVGTTNKTHLRDYEEALGPETALLLKVHTSNFQVVGFTEEVPLSELSKLGLRHNVAVMEDLGSGCLIDFSRLGLAKEPTVREALASGADLVTFSGDKLLGGPQTGIILGKSPLIERIKKNPINRALRIDKLTLLALEETLRLYRDERTAVKEIPTLRMLCQPYRSLKRKAERLRSLIGSVAPGNFTIEFVDGNSRPGGGALPLAELPSRLLCLVPGTLSARFMETWFRRRARPVITRLEKDHVLLDVRTVLDRELKTVARAVVELSEVQAGRD